MATTEKLTPRQRLSQLTGRSTSPSLASRTITSGKASIPVPPSNRDEGRLYLVLNQLTPAPVMNVNEAIRKRLLTPPVAKPMEPPQSNVNGDSSVGSSTSTDAALTDIFSVILDSRNDVQQEPQEVAAVKKTLEVTPTEDVPLLSPREQMLKGLIASALAATKERNSESQPIEAQMVEGLDKTVPTAPQSKPLSLRERLRASASAAPGGAPDNFDFDNGPAESSSSFTSTSQDVKLEDLTGTLSSIKEFNGWAVGTIWTEDRVEHKVKGESLAGLTEGLEYALKGRMTSHAVYEPSFEVHSAQPTISPNDKSIQHFMVKSFKGIGDVKAAKYVKSLREEGGEEAVEALRQTLLNSPWTLDLTKIAKDAKFNESEDPQGAMKQLMVSRNLMLNLGGKGGLRESTAKLLAAYLITEVTPKAQPGQEKQDELAALGAGDVVSKTWSTLMLNPYAPIHDVAGYGFGMAEAIAAKAGIPKDSPLRLGALVEYAVEEGCRRRGHTFLRTAEFVEAIKRVDPSAPAQQALIHAIEQSLVVIDGKRVYPSRLLEAEKDVAERLAELMQVSEPMTKRTTAAIYRKLEQEPEKINEAFKEGFDDQQKAAISNIMTGTQRLHVLTGGPGTGKTAIMEVLLTLLKTKSFIFCGPTGKSAKVLTNRVSGFGYNASTVNSVLKGAEEVGFEVNAENPLDCDVLVVDENTMNGIGMAAGILAALPPNAHLIVMGDPGLPTNPNVPGSARAGQLPSISPGRFMQDLLLLPGVQHTHLSKTYRNSGGILEVVEEMSRGVFTGVERTCVKLSHSLPEASTGFPEVMEEYLGKVAKNGFEGTSLIMPIRKGERETPGWNATYANHVLRKVCNPYGQKLPGTQLYLGDRIIVRENMQIAQPKKSALGNVVLDPSARNFLPELPKPKPGGRADDPESFFSDDEEDDEDVERKRVVNGDTGTIIGYAMGNSSKQLGSPTWIRLALDDGQIVEFPGADAGSLDHSYAGSVHSAQGSEYKNVIMVVTPGSPDFMHQNMLLTGFSRPREHLSIWGDDKVIRKIAATVMPARNSGLVDRVKQHLVDADQPNAEENLEIDQP